MSKGIIKMVILKKSGSVVRQRLFHGLENMMK